MSAALRTADVVPLHRPRASFAWLPEQGRLLVALSGEVTGQDFLSLMQRCLAAHPEAATADWVLDLRAYRGSIAREEVAELATLSHAVARGRDERCLAVAVTPDRNVAPWLVAARAWLRPRRLEVVATLTEAEAMLASPAL